MPKKKRTRKDKIQADIKRQSTPSLAHPTRPVAVTREAKEPEKTKQTSGSFSLPQRYTDQIKTHPTTASAKISTSAYGYLQGDLLKTTVLTFSIIGAELLIYFMMMK